MESPRQQKKELRLVHKELRLVVKRSLRNFPLESRQQEDIATQNHVLSAEWFKQSRSLYAYLSYASLREVDTNHIVPAVLQHYDSGMLRFRVLEIAKELYAPRVLDREASMAMLHVSTRKSGKNSLLLK